MKWVKNGDLDITLASGIEPPVSKSFYQVLVLQKIQEISQDRV